VPLGVPIEVPFCNTV
jgi:hypothetical protein